MAKRLLFYVPAALFLLLAAVVAVMWIEHKLPLTLPVLPGSYPVGRVIYHWVDSSRVDSAAPGPGIKRELMVWVWYPADTGVNGGAGRGVGGGAGGGTNAGVGGSADVEAGADKCAPYLPASLQKKLGEMQGFVMRDLFTSDPLAVRTHSMDVPRRVAGAGRYPVVLMNSGIGAFAADYTTYAESLAAAGYIVVGCDRPYSTLVVIFPDGRVVYRSAAGHPGEAGDPANFDRLAGYWSRDERFILDKLSELNNHDPMEKFTGRIDLEHVGVFGHSFGGATAMQFCVDDPRCKAAANLDGQPFGSVVNIGTSKPLLVLLGDHSREPDAVTARIKSRIARIVRSCPFAGDSGGVQYRCADHYWYQVKGACHFNFSDMALTKEKWLMRVAGATGPIGGRRGLEVTAGCLRTFFDVYLKGASKSALDSLRVRYPELGLPVGDPPGKPESRT
jgi:pimeloyl-ACP methyl ester carboxylesterase